MIPYKFSKTDVACTAAFMMEGLLSVDQVQLHEIKDDMATGFVELTYDMVQYAEYVHEYIQDLAERHEWNFPGVMDYEVSSLFGGWYGQHILANHEQPSDDVCRGKVRELLITFFNQ